MPERHSLRLIKNGIAVMIISLLAGFMLAFSMIGAISFSPLPIFVHAQIPGSSQGWHAVHVGAMMNGLMAVLIGVVARWFAVSERAALIVSWGTIIAIWANVCFYVFAMFAPNHGLSLQSNGLGPANLAGAIAFLPAFVGAITLLAALLVLFFAKPLNTHP
jgi:hypothetical protein